MRTMTMMMMMMTTMMTMIMMMFVHLHYDDDDNNGDNKDVKTDKGHTIIVNNKLMIMTIIMTNVKSGVR